MNGGDDVNEVPIIFYYYYYYSVANYCHRDVEKILEHVIRTKCSETKEKNFGRILQFNHKK